MSNHTSDSHKIPHPIIIQLDILIEKDPRTHKELTAIDGISRQTWNSWVTGTNDPALTRVQKRATTLNREIIITIANIKEKP